MRKLSELVGSGPLLLDFDGPMCAMFAGLPAPKVAADLVALLERQTSAGPPSQPRQTPQAGQPNTSGRPNPRQDLNSREGPAPLGSLHPPGQPAPGAPLETHDPLAVLRWAGDHGSPALTATLEDALITAEQTAAASARPTPFAREVLENARARGLPLAVVSNNSTPAIELYLHAHGLTDYIDVIVGRPYADPRRMKPHPAPVLAAVEALAGTPNRCTLIGDSLTDIEAARAAGVPVIAYANRPWKVNAFTPADAVITSMSELVDALI